MSRFIAFVMVFLIPGLSMAKTHKASVYLKGDSAVKIADYTPGDRAGDKEKFSSANLSLLKKLFQQNKNEIFLCWGLSDAIKCHNKRGNANSRCQAALRRDRCDAIGEVAANFQVIILHAAGGKGLEVDPGHRGVVLKKMTFKGQKVPYCSEKDFKNIRRVYLKTLRRRISRKKLMVVPEDMSEDEFERIRVVLITYNWRFNRQEKPSVRPNKICKAMITGKVVKRRRPVKKPVVAETLPPKTAKPVKNNPPPCPEGKHREGGVCVFDPCPEGQIRVDGICKAEDPVVDPSVETEDATKQVKKPDETKDKDKKKDIDESPSSPLPLPLRKALVFGGVYYAKECTSLTTAEAFNFAIEGIFPFWQNEHFAVRGALGLRSHSYNYYRAATDEINTVRHEIFGYIGLEGMFRFQKGELGLRVGNLFDTNLEKYRIQGEAIGRFFVYKQKLAIDLRLGVGHFQYSSEVDPTETEGRWYGYGLAGLTYHF